MNLKIAKVVARSIATHIVETHGTNIDSLTISEMTADQFPELEGDTFEALTDLVQNYIDVSDLHVHFDEWRLDSNGNKLSDEEVKARRSEPFDF